MSQSSQEKKNKEQNNKIIIPFFKWNANISLIDRKKRIPII
jgi:hypothetical protein